MKNLHYEGPIVLAILDGVGLSTARSGNAVRQAHTEFLDQAMINYLNIPLLASGEAVGIMPGQMGNSEVGHNAIGSGQIIKQGIAQVEAAFATGDIWQSKAWKGAMKKLGVHGTAENRQYSRSHPEARPRLSGATLQRQASRTRAPTRMLTGRRQRRAPCIFVVSFLTVAYTAISNISSK